MGRPSQKRIDLDQIGVRASGCGRLILQLATLSNGGFGSWLCENVEALRRDRRSYSSKVVLVLKLASAFNLENELKNVILAVFRSSTFSHSQGQSLQVVRRWAGREVRFGSKTDLIPMLNPVAHASRLCNRAEEYGHAGSS